MTLTMTPIPTPSLLKKEPLMIGAFKCKSSITLAWHECVTGSLVGWGIQRVPDRLEHDLQGRAVSGLGR